MLEYRNFRGGVKVCGEYLYWKEFSATHAGAGLINILLMSAFSRRHARQSNELRECSEKKQRSVEVCLVVLLLVVVVGVVVLDGYSPVLASALSLANLLVASEWQRSPSLRGHSTSAAFGFMIFIALVMLVTT